MRQFTCVTHAAFPWHLHRLAAISVHHSCSHKRNAAQRRGYVVPEASHPVVTNRACPGREQMVAHPVVAADYPLPITHARQGIAELSTIHLSMIHCLLRLVSLETLMASTVSSFTMCCFLCFFVTLKVALRFVRKILPDSSWQSFWSFSESNFRHGKTP